MSVDPITGEEISRRVSSAILEIANRTLTGGIGQSGDIAGIAGDAIAGTLTSVSDNLIEGAFEGVRQQADQTTTALGTLQAALEGASRRLQQGAAIGQGSLDSVLASVARPAARGIVGRATQIAPAGAAELGENR